MKKNGKRILAVVLSLLLTAGVLLPAAAQDDAGCAVGDLVEFGSYPQTKVTDGSLLDALNAAPQRWISYNYYYRGAYLSYTYGILQSNYMQYCDVFYGGETYRGVRFSQYRPYYSDASPSADYSFQDDNGYDPGTTYWFRWEPLVWRVLDPAAGLILCETIIDSQAYKNEIDREAYVDEDGNYHVEYWSEEFVHNSYANNYGVSDLYFWFLDRPYSSDAYYFFETAFTEAQRAQLRTTSINTRYFDPDMRSDYISYGCEARVFPLSWADATNEAYGFGDDWHIDPLRLTRGTDYAKCQGLFVDPENNGYSPWWLCTPGLGDNNACFADSTGYIECQGGHHAGEWFHVDFSCVGVRPAIRLDLTNVAAHTHSYMPTVTASCTEGGDTVYTCLCGDSYTGEHVDALGHDFGEWVVTTPATTEAQGEQTRTCRTCGCTETRSIPRLPVPAVLAVTVPETPVYTCDPFTVTVDLSQNPGLAALSLALSYDPDVLTLTDVQRGGMLQSGSMSCSGSLSALPYKILWEDALERTPHTESGTILTLTFTVDEAAAAGETAVTLTYEAASTFDIDLHLVPLTISDGALTVRIHTPGDADGDGILSLQDTANIMRALAGGWGVVIDTRNSDVNGDGKVNLQDVVLIRRCLAGGWGVTLR